MLSNAGPEPKPNAMELVSLCCSLNSPVVSIPELPVGPASAAIAIHTDAVRGSQITVAVRCRRTADVVLYRACGDSSDIAGVSEHAALLWAEGLGFLFDEDLCTDPVNEAGVRNEFANEIWSELVQESQPGSADLEPCTDPAESDAVAVLSKFRFQRCDSSPTANASAGPEEFVTAVTSSNESWQRPSLIAAAVA